MQKVVLQVPVSKNLRDNATAAAQEYGFSSLQEILRVFISKLAAKKINISFDETIHLSKTAEKYLAKIDRDFKKGKNIYRAKNVDELMKQLHGNSLP